GKGPGVHRCFSVVEAARNRARGSVHPSAFLHARLGSTLSKSAYSSTSVNITVMLLSVVVGKRRPFPASREMYHWTTRARVEQGGESQVHQRPAKEHKQRPHGQIRAEGHRAT